MKTSKQERTLEEKNTLLVERLSRRQVTTAEAMPKRCEGLYEEKSSVRVELEEDESATTMCLTEDGAT